MLLYEPTKAEDEGSRCWGSDRVSLKYPSVNTCLTLTYAYPDRLVGAHLGLHERNGDVVTYGRIYSVLGLLDREAPPRVAPTHAFLIGNKILWQNQAEQKISLLRQHIFDRTGEYGGYAPWEETGDYPGGTVDVEIFRYGLVTIRSTDGARVDTRRFAPGGVIPTAARARLGI